MNVSIFKDELRRNEIISTGILGHVFKTEKNKYFYDVISSKILKVKDILFDVLDALTGLYKENRIKGFYELRKKYSEEKIFECLKEIKRQKDKKGLFKNIPPDFKFDINDRGIVLASYDTIILEVTQNCNFRCSYCAFSGTYKYERNHTKTNMSEKIALKAINFFLKNLGEGFIPSITFYGGEPLIQKKLIRKCVDFARSKHSSVKFDIQTNGYLLDKEFIEYLYRNNFDLSVSIDGPKEIHDRCRRLASGEGTYDKIISNLNHLYEIDKDYYKSKVNISYTYGTRGHFKELINFHNNNPLMKGLKLNLNYISKVGLNDDVDYYEMIKSHPDNYQELVEMMDESFWAYVKEMSENIRFEDILFTRGLINIIYRRPVDKNEFILKGPCSLGRKKLFVSAEGDYKVCDRTTRLPSIGNVREGINWNYIKELENTFLESCHDCYKCWAMSLCQICWVHLYTNKPGIDIDTKRTYCRYYKEEYSEQLRRYAQIVECDPNILDRLESDYRKNRI